MKTSFWLSLAVKAPPRFILDPCLPSRSLYTCTISNNQSFKESRLQKDRFKDWQLSKLSSWFHHLLLDRNFRITNKSSFKSVEVWFIAENSWSFILLFHFWIHLSATHDLIGLDFDLNYEARASSSFISIQLKNFWALTLRFYRSDVIRSPIDWSLERWRIKKLLRNVLRKIRLSWWSSWYGVYKRD